MNSINMRSSKMKFLVYGCVICGMVLTIYLLSNTHTKLKTVKGAYDICLQQKDSLLAQLQVVYEQKSRVEKSLQKEKLDHKKTKDDFQDNIRAKLDIDKEKKDAEEKYASLQQEYQSLQDKYTHLKEKSNQLEENFRKYQEEAESLGQNKETEIKNLNSKLSGLVLSNEQLKQNYNNQEKDLAQLTEKLNSLQLLNTQLLQKAQAQQPLEKNINNHDHAIALESNAVNNQDPTKNGENAKANKPPNQVKRTISASKLSTAGVVYVNEKNPALGYDDDPHVNFHHNLNRNQAPPPMPYHNLNSQFPPPWHLPESALQNNHGALLPAHPISPPNNFGQPINYKPPHLDLNTYHHNLQRDTVNMPGIDHPGLENYHAKDLERKGLRFSNDVEGGNSLGMEIHDKNSKQKEKRSVPDLAHDYQGLKIIRGHIINR